MELTTTYKKVLVVMILLLAGFMSQAQHIVVVGSTRTFRVAQSAGHVYQWEVVYNGIAQKIKRNTDGSYTIGEGTTTIVGGLDPSNDDFKKFFKISLKCPMIAGDYTLRMTEANASGCYRENLIPVKIVDSPLRFRLDKHKQYEVVNPYDGIDRRNIMIPITFTDNVNSTWSNIYYEKHNAGQYTVTIQYSFYKEDGVKGIYTIEKEVNNTADILYSCKDDFKKNFNRELIESESDNSDRYFEFEIVAVKDRYGADVRVVGDKKFVLGIYKKAHITKINHK